MADVAVFTDSTASLPLDRVVRAGLGVIPLQVVIDGRSRAEGATGASPEAVAEAIRTGRRVSTSRPAIDEFAAAYRSAAEAGATAAVVLPMSARMSGTFDAATVAARAAPIPVRVIDTGTLAMALGFAAISAGTAAAGGGDLDRVAAAAAGRAAAAETYFVVDDLEQLRRGGRIGAAAALLGSALAVKPLLTLVDGEIRPRERVRTANRARIRLEELATVAMAKAYATGRRVGLAVHYLDDPAPAEELAFRLQRRAEGPLDLVITPVSAVLGVHTGPRTLGVVVSPE
ncbi:DegV family protein [Microlunatus speluncae]|uniref:DegV family protein n=1 Tax=Microlunatus speluncae TaxID=2594267 RepID=UPI001266085C|nr:DegV family protein [Microlunatus speluncae]